jgi:hypothetical protein
MVTRQQLYRCVRAPFTHMKKEYKKYSREELTCIWLLEIGEWVMKWK